MSRMGFGRTLGDRGLMGRSLAAVVLAGAWVATWRPQVDPDAWWHLAIGDSILRNGAIPGVEPFSWLTAGDRFVAHSWLWDILMVGAYRAADATGTSVLGLAATALVIALVWALIAMTAPGVAPLGRALLVAIAMLASLPLWAPRAQTLDVVFVLAVVLVIERYLRFGERRGLVLLPIIGVLWANLHGSAVLALGACVGVAVLAAPIGVKWGVWPRRSLGPLVVAGIAGVAVALANPYGLTLLAYPFDRAVASAFSPLIVEWRAPDFGGPGLLAARLIVAAGALVAIGGRPRSADPLLLLSAAAWTFASLGAVRLLPIAVALLVVALAPAIEPATRRWLAWREDDVADPAMEGKGARVATDPRGRWLLAAATVVIVATILVVGWTFIAPGSQIAAIERRMPVAAMAALRSAGCPVRTLPAYDWAGYVIWSEGRDVGAYGNSAESSVAAQAALESVTTDPRPWLDENGVEAVLMPAGGPLSHWLDEADEWRLAWHDAEATIHIRAGRNDCPFGY